MEFFGRHRSIVAFIFGSLFCIISLSVQSSTFTLSVEGVLSAVVMPFQKGYDAVQEGASRFWAGFSELGNVREELNRSRAKLQNYEALAEDFSEIRRENDRLRKLIGLREKIRYDSITASIISKDPDNWFRTIIINRGENDGIQVNMPVVAFQGDFKAVVGKVIEVRGSVSRILPVISPDMKMGVKFRQDRFPGLLSGYSYNSSLCVINYITRAAHVKLGNIIITSGQAGVFPPGLLVGTVVKSELLEASSYRRAIVKPMIDYNLLEEVFIIKKKPDKDLYDLFEEMQ